MRSGDALTALQRTWNRRRSSVLSFRLKRKVRCEMFGAIWDFVCDVITRMGETMRDDPFKFD